MHRSWLFVVSAALGIFCHAVAAQSSQSFCSTHATDLYCLTPNLYANPVPDPFTAILSTIGSQLGMVPLASPASGIIYVTNPSLKIPVPAGTETFGPVLVERGETLGARRAFIAFTYQHFSFSSIDGVDLSSIPVLFNVCDPSNGQCAPIATNNSIKPTINQFAFFGTYGITSRIDVSLAVPVINSTLTAASTTCTAPYCRTPIFSNQQLIIFTPTTVSGSATGIGDVVLRAKGQIWRGERARLAAGVDFRLPSGDALNFLGTGATGVRPFVALSRSGYVAPHVNLAYQWNGDSVIGGVVPGVNTKLPDNLFWDAGADIRANKQLTIAADVLGEYVYDALRLQYVQVTPQPTSAVPVPVTVTSVGISRGKYPTLQGSVGFKLNPWKDLLFSGNVLFSLSHNGLRNNIVPLVGASYTF